MAASACDRNREHKGRSSHRRDVVNASLSDASDDGGGRDNDSADYPDASDDPSNSSTAPLSDAPFDSDAND